MTLNLAEVQQNVDRLLTTCSTIVGTYWDMFYDPSPGDVSVPVYDDEGNLSTVSLPNRSKVIADGEAALDSAVIGEDMTIFVSPSGSDTTGDGSDARPYATIPTALAKVNGRVFLPGVTVDIQLDDGVYSVTGTIRISHPYGSQITISGKNTYETTMSAVTVNGSAAVITIGDAGNISTGDMVMVLSPSGGTNPEALAGAYSVTAVSGNQVTLAWPADAGVTPDGAVTGTVTVLKSILKMDLVSGVTGTGFMIYTAANFKNFGVRYGSGNSVYAFRYGGANQISNMTAIGITGVNNGVLADVNTVVVLGQCGISDLSGNGLNCAMTGYASIRDSAIVRPVGGLFSAGGVIHTGSIIVTGAQCGAESKSGGRIFVDASTIKHNVTGLFAHNASTIVVNSATVISDNDTDLSPVSNTVGNNNSIIIV